MREPRWRDVIKEAWKGSNDGNLMLSSKLKECEKTLIRWNKEEFVHIGNPILRQRELISNLQKQTMSEPLRRRIKWESSKLYDLLAEEEDMWRQRSRVDWLIWGDSLLKLQDEDGN
ncbi:hypothetical protein M5689_003464 [Euphorbia peplus]|nr:hypothetical protein M5689_003464 [Euphorbia peplus]